MIQLDAFCPPSHAGERDTKLPTALHAVLRLPQELPASWLSEYISQAYRWAGRDMWSPLPVDPAAPAPLAEEGR